MIVKIERIFIFISFSFYTFWLIGVGCKLHSIELAGWKDYEFRPEPAIGSTRWTIL